MDNSDILTSGPSRVVHSGLEGPKVKDVLGSNMNGPAGSMSVALHLFILREIQVHLPQGFRLWERALYSVSFFFELRSDAKFEFSYSIIIIYLCIKI